MGWCTHCDKEVEGIGKRNNLCPDCGQFIKKEKPTKIAKKSLPKHGIVKTEPQTEFVEDSGIPPVDQRIGTSSRASSVFSGVEQGMAEMLIKSGYAKNIEELQRKNLHLTYNTLTSNFGGNSMKNPKEEESLEDIDKLEDKELLREYKQIKLQRMKEELEKKKGLESKRVEPPSEDELEKLEKQMARQMRMKQMQRMIGDDKKEGGFTMGDFMQYMLLKDLAGNKSNDGSSKELQMLQQQIQNMQNQSQQKQFLEIATNMKGREGLSAEDVLKFTTDKNVAVESERLKTQAEREDKIREQIDNKLMEIEARAAKNPSDIIKLKEDLKAIKEVASELGEKKSGFADILGATIAQPGVQNLVAEGAEALKQRREEKLMRQQMPQPIPMQQPQQPIPEEQQNPENIQIRDPQQEPVIRNPSNPNPFGLTPAEQALSEDADQYLYTRKIKKK